MRELFSKRRSLFLSRCLKYLRYVLNDHFVLVLMVFLGFILLQYKALLENFPKNPFYLWLILLGVTGTLVFSGTIATYLESADSLFLLVREREVSQHMKKSSHVAYLFWAGLQVVFQLFLLPLYLKLGLSLWGFGLYLMCVLGVQYGIFARKHSALLDGQRVDWVRAIQTEKRRKQGILQFFALFTHVKGITSSVKRRAYLDALTLFVRKSQKQTWDYLFIRSFLRSGDFFALGLRLLGLSLLFLITLSESWLAIALAVLLLYLFFFQLLALYRAYEYQSLTQLYPLEASAKWASFRRVTSYITYIFVGCQTLVGAVFVSEKVYLIALPVFALFLTMIYLPMKSKKLID